MEYETNSISLLEDFKKEKIIFKFDKKDHTYFKSFFFEVFYDQPDK